MIPQTATRLAAAAGLALALAGCIDADIDIDVLSETHARATMTQVMSGEFYAMVQMGASESDEDGFCADGELRENEDGSATCVLVEEGPFAELTVGDEEDGGVTFTVVGPGLVRVGFDTGGLAEEVGADENLDEETRQMMLAFFTGHAITIRVGGGTITETNMEQVEGRAQTVIPFVDLIEGSVELPDELYAVVRVN